MRKRGPVVMLAGAVVAAASLATVLYFIPDAGPIVNNQLPVDDLLEGIFTEVSGEVLLYPGEANTFSHTPSDPGVTVMWGLQVPEHRSGDVFTVSVIAGGEELGSHRISGPVHFSVLAPDTGAADFHVENTGGRPAAVVMMFVDDPENSEALNNPDSPLLTVLLPLAVAGTLLMIGIISAASGGIITLVDWNRSRSQ
ncbi:hypothetical protein CENSYa_1397 [Cenarchaeum symbiosum A]|uniref:Uncharacterized protein n=1 Tax=Cenarchaeum symbiosum (strain A) TaxID=414004 RepID=A0RXF3_CENSY|nr:hypothetical protein CENSYa_1397 [Cenarchaeum symbiosum A]